MAAHQRVAVFVHLARIVASTRAEVRRFRVPLTHPARCEHRREKRGAGASVFGYFWGNAKSDWPRAAVEREGGRRSWFDKLTTNGGMHRSNERLMRRVKPVAEGLKQGLRRRLAVIDCHFRASTTCVASGELSHRVQA